MTCTNFPSAGLVIGVTTHQVGEIIYLWSGVVWEAIAPPLDLASDPSQAWEFPTVTAYKASTIVFPVGKIVNLLDRDASFTVIAGTGTATGYKIIASDQVSQSIDLVHSIPLNPYEWGAVADGVTDDQPAIQAAIDFAKTNSTNITSIPVHIRAGLYGLNLPLDRTGNNIYVDIFGDGVRNTSLKALVAMTAMIELADGVSANPGLTTIRDMTLFCNGLADRGIDAKHMRYWTKTNVETREPLISGCRAGNWVSRILRNRYLNCPVGLEVEDENGGSAQNNFIVQYNDFNTCPVGMQVNDFSNNVNVMFNSFDGCLDAGLWCKEGGRNININNNYFEACGLGVGVDALINGGGTESMPAAIVIGYVPSSITNSRWTGDIRDNLIANCTTARAITLYNVLEGNVEENRIEEGTTYSALVELRDEGVNIVNGKRLSVKGAYGAEVAKLVELNTLAASSNQSNLVIDNVQSPVSLNTKFHINDPTTAAWTGATVINTSDYGGFKEFEFTGTSVDKIFNVDFTVLTDHPLLGRYIRVNSLVKGSAGNSGVRLRVDISGVSAIDQNRNGSTYINSGRGIVVYIPTTATSFKITLDQQSSGVSAKMIGFSVCDAGYELNEAPVAIS